MASNFQKAIRRQEIRNQRKTKLLHCTQESQNKLLVDLPAGAVFSPNLLEMTELRSGRGAAGGCAGQNGQKSHFGQYDLIPKHILAFNGPKWTKMAHLRSISGPFWPTWVRQLILKTDVSARAHGPEPMILTLETQASSKLS